MHSEGDARLSVCLWVCSRFNSLYDGLFDPETIPPTQHITKISNLAILLERRRSNSKNWQSRRGSYFTATPRDVANISAYIFGVIHGIFAPRVCTLVLLIIFTILNTPKHTCKKRINKEINRYRKRGPAADWTTV